MCTYEHVKKSYPDFYIYVKINKSHPYPLFLQEKNSGSYELIKSMVIKIYHSLFASEILRSKLFASLKKFLNIVHNL